MIHLTNILPTPLVETTDGISPKSDVFGVDCHFEKGNNYLVAARSGKGKSTLLHIIYGLRKDFSGQLSINGKDTSKWNADDWASLRQNQLSIVFQDLRLFPQLTAWENILLKANLTQNTSEEEIHEMAESLGMTHFLHQTAETLSYGQRQRIAIIRALCQPFDLLLLDEPFSHLDQKNIDSAVQLILAAIKKNGAGMLLSSLGENHGLTFSEELEL